jgi:hypothetical protein
MDGVESNIRSSIESLAAGTEWVTFAITVMDDAAGEFVGFCEWTFHAGEHSGFDAHRLAIHPAKRGMGHFPTFSDGMAYIANQVLGAEGARYLYYAVETVEGEPIRPGDRGKKDDVLAGRARATEHKSTLATMRDHMGGVVIPERAPDHDARLSCVQLDRQTVASRLFGGQSRFALVT